MTTPDLTQRLDAGPVIVAEGFLFELERRGYLSAGEFVPEVALENPQILRQLHIDFQHAGSDIVEAFTYNGHREKMRAIGKEELLEPLNRAALRIAREVAENTPDGMTPNLMAGNISNTNIWNPDDPAVQKEVIAMFEEMTYWAVDEGADMMIGETFYYAGEAYAALDVLRTSALPVVLTLGVMNDGLMQDCVDPVTCCRELEKKGATVVGLNCFRGPATMMPLLKEVRKAVDCHVAALPVPYRTHEKEATFFNLSDSHCNCTLPHGRTFPTALDPLFANRYEIGDFIRDAYQLGVHYLGICCGNNPMLTRQAAEAVGRTVPASRYSEKLERHFMYGDNERLPEHIRNLGEKA